MPATRPSNAASLGAYPIGNGGSSGAIIGIGNNTSYYASRDMRIAGRMNAITAASPQSLKTTRKTPSDKNCHTNLNEFGDLLTW